MIENNGILSHVPGPCIAKGMAMLPPPDTAEDRTYEVVIDGEHAGTVRLFLRRQYTKHGRLGHWYWLAYRAESVTA